MEKFTVYCQIDFLKEYYNNRPKIEDDFFSDKNNYWFELGKLIHKHSNLIIDIDKNDLLKIARENKLIMRLIKERNQGGSELIPIPKEFEYMNEDENYFQNRTSELYMLNKTEKECTKLENQYGNIFISKDNIQKSKFLFESEIIPLKKNKKGLKDWSFIKKFKHPFNSIIIADNYIFDKNNTKRIDKNLIQILKNILPKRLNKQSIALTIFAKNETFNIDFIYNYLKEKFKNEFPNFNFKFTIIGVDKYDLHDRNILTNYMWINSGYGFSIFYKNRVMQDTHISFFPITYLQPQLFGYNKITTETATHKNILEIHSYLLNQLKKAKSIEIIGENKNRLLN